VKIITYVDVDVLVNQFVLSSISDGLRRESELLTANIYVKARIPCLPSVFLPK